MSAFTVQRITLVANTAYPVEAPVLFKNVVIGNLLGVDLRIYSDIDSATAYVALTDGFERAFPLPQYYAPGATLFTLRATVGGTVFLIWY